MHTNFYDDHAQKLAEQYLSKTFEEVHAAWSEFLPPILNKPNARILDLGAGAGRDSRYLAEQGQVNDISIVAVEPAKLLAEIGQQQTQGLNVKWVEDSLPALDVVCRQEVSFDLILLSAVWMHIPKSERPRAIRKLANLLKPGAKLVISLRHGPSGDERKMHDVSTEELELLAKTVGLSVVLKTEHDSDKLGRDTVHWQTVVLQLPDDGSGAFPFIRHVAINDNKSGTHKLALMRVLLRIADGHPGAVIRRKDSPQGVRVILPVGLVALYWCHQYKILIDGHGLYQTTRDEPNMGFMTDKGWHKLTSRAAEDYRIGHLFVGKDAIALHRTLSAAVKNIKDMPCKYITLPNSDINVFEVDSKTVRARDSLFLDMESLSQWGEFSLPETVWNAFSRYACWVEPVLVSEWMKTMKGYRGNQSPRQQLAIVNSLDWLEAKRSTAESRARFDLLRQQQEQQCVWSGKVLKQEFAIDHCMPFARWPNNDLWNLLPSDSKVNGQKSDSLPTAKKLKDAKFRITDWWQQAWTDDDTQSTRFFAEANIALPGLTINNTSIDDLFEALELQRGRLKEMQQLREWG
ncbi:MAG: methyltransferase domain-containing protein [Moritella sp.]|uniref:class I SAM-dependent methyltransferase n=1 Tax=Moritella sp. TaxID=78556 RepID=UPI0025F34111|nr:class I SAM-dependent methyltransferase [Moritella sp.]NQZ93555.1 methyltransferase domain-containing protein [Moritella sp.]